MHQKEREKHEDAGSSSAARRALVRLRHRRHKLFMVLVGGAVLVILGIGIFFMVSKSRPEKHKQTAPVAELVEAAEQKCPVKKVDKSEYLFPESNRVLLTEADIAECDRNTLKLGRNEIFARHGYIFQTTEVAEYFEAKPWYHGTTPGERFDSNLFNGIELQNIDFLAVAQKKLEYRENAQRVADKIAAVQKDFTIPQNGADSSVLVHAFLAEDKPMVLAFRLVDLNHDDVPALFLAYLTSANAPSSDNIQAFSGWCEVWAMDKDDFVCVQKEKFGVSAAGGGDGFTASIFCADTGKADEFLTYYHSTQAVTEHVYSFIEENGSKDKYQIYEYWGEEAREPDGTHNGGKLTDAAKQLKRCTAMQEEADPLFYIGFNAVPDWTNVLQIYEDIAKNISDARAAVQAVTKNAA